jgi:hypothetical protein
VQLNQVDAILSLKSLPSNDDTTREMSAELLFAFADVSLLVIMFALHQRIESINGSGCSARFIRQMILE